MTAIGMLLRFQQELQNHLNINIDIRTIDIEWFLNRGQDLWVDEIHAKYKGQEELRKRLGALIVTETNTAGDIGSGIHGGEIWEIESDVRYILDEAANDNGIPVKPVDSVYFNKQSKNPYKKPSTSLIWRMDAGEFEHELIAHDDVTIANYSYTYIKTPVRIDLHAASPVSCEIGEIWHDEIVDRAVEYALGVYAATGRLKTDEELRK
jgi:hypothetical protein